MTNLLSEFREFCRHTILPEGDDYLVPIEAKGVLLLNAALADQPADLARVRFRRAFDFMAAPELKNKSAAIIDDTVVLGRTLNRAADALTQRGMTKIAKYTCIIYDDPKRAPYRRVSDIRPCEWLQQRDYDLILEDLSALTLRQRPAYPDHLLFAVAFTEPLPTDGLANTCEQYGDLVEYRRQQNARNFSIHYPTFTPVLPAYARDTGPNKLRVTADYLGDHIICSPGFFPSLIDAAAAMHNDPLCAAIYEVFNRHSQEHADKNLNVYESFTLSVRTQMTRNFVQALREEGFPVSKTSLLVTNLNAYYGEPVARELANLITDVMETPPTGPLPRARFAQDDSESEPVFDAYNLTKQALTAIEAAYRALNVSKPDIYDWTSTGLNLDELATTINHSKAATSIALEMLNDYGYSVPIPVDHTKPHLQRTYRSTELGGRRLAL